MNAAMSMPKISASADCSSITLYCAWASVIVTPRFSRSSIIDSIADRPKIGSNVSNAERNSLVERFWAYAKDSPFSANELLEYRCFALNTIVCHILTVCPKSNSFALIHSRLLFQNLAIGLSGHEFGKNYRPYSPGVGTPAFGPE